jgi:predicted glycoside hydrolase/deacetylase ChbG (UPF0249 family)
MLCADDYALSPGISRAIRQLLASGRLNAISVMTIFPDLEEEAKALLATKSPISFSIGLHATLTGGFRPLVAAPLSSADGSLPPGTRLWPPMGFFRVNRRAVKAEVRAQIEKFKKSFGRAPDFVDGHQHVQLMPGVRSSFLAAVSEFAPKAWVRQCSPARARDDLFGDSKARFLGALSRGFRKHARRMGLAFNPAFAGAYDYSSTRDFGPLLERFLEYLPPGGVIMCHPGHIDEILIGRDTLIDQREKEFEFLMSDRFLETIRRADVTLA